MSNQCPSSFVLYLKWTLVVQDGPATCPQFGMCAVFLSLEGATLVQLSVTPSHKTQTGSTRQPGLENILTLHMKICHLNLWHRRHRPLWCSGRQHVTQQQEQCGVRNEMVTKRTCGGLLDCCSSTSWQVSGVCPSSNREPRQWNNTFIEQGALCVALFIVD